MGERETVVIAPRRGQHGAVVEALRTGLGMAAPEMGRFTAADGLTLLRTAPHQMLAVQRSGGLSDRLAQLLDGLAGVIDISGARTAVLVRGGTAARLRSLLPLDLETMQAGDCAQTVMAHLTVLVCKLDDTPQFGISCASSYRASFHRAFELAGCDFMLDA